MYSNCLKGNRLGYCLNVLLILLIRRVLWHHKNHALAVVVKYSESVPSYIHPLWQRLLIILQVKLLLPSQHFKVDLIDVIRYMMT